VDAIREYLERQNIADFAQPFLPALHPWMRRRRARSGSEKKKRLHHVDVDLARFGNNL